MQQRLNLVDLEKYFRLSLRASMQPSTDLHPTPGPSPRESDQQLCVQLPLPAVMSAQHARAATFLGAPPDRFFGFSITEYENIRSLSGLSDRGVSY